MRSSSCEKSSTSTCRHHSQQSTTRHSSTRCTGDSASSASRMRVRTISRRPSAARSSIDPVGKSGTRRSPGRAASAPTMTFGARASLADLAKGLTADRAVSLCETRNAGNMMLCGRRPLNKPGTAMRQIPVLIVGGGPVGLALAAELGWRGVGCELIEQGDGAIVTPKMNEVNVRTMEFCRRWGIADQVLNCPFPADYPFDVVFVTSLAGHEIGRMRAAVALAADARKPTARCGCRPARRCGSIRCCARSRRSSPAVRLRHRTRLEAFEDTRRRRHCRPGRSRQRRARAHRGGLPGRLRRRHQRDPRRARHRARRARACSAIRCTCSSARPICLQQCGKEPGTFFLAIDRDGLWANIRIIDPANAMWRLMVLDSDGKQTPETRRQGRR